MKVIHLTEEEIDDLNKRAKVISNSASYAGYGKYYDPYTDWDSERDYPPAVPKRKHEWKPTLLLISTVYTCANCGAKQEKAKGEYCEPEEF